MVIVHLFIFYFFVSFLLIMTFDLKAQPASISSAICRLHRIIIVFSSLTNKMEWNGMAVSPKSHAFPLCAAVASAVWTSTTSLCVFPPVITCIP